MHNEYLCHFRIDNQEPTWTLNRLYESSDITYIIFGTLLTTSWFWMSTQNIWECFLKSVAHIFGNKSSLYINQFEFITFSFQSLQFYQSRYLQ